MPAVGTDGRTVMNLIPVQKVNGQFVQSPTGTIKDIAETKRDYTSNVPSISKSNISISGPTAKEQFVNKRPFYVSTSPNPANLTGIYPSVRIQTPIVTTKVAQSAGSLTSPEFTCGNTFGLTLINKKKLPVTVKSPALPNGQYLQIPPNAQVKTLPASALPPGIKRQIFTSSTTCASNSPMVLYVSPVQTMKHNYVPTSPKSAPSLSRLPRSSGQTLSTCSSTGSRQCSITAKDGKRLVTPIKWVIEEADGLPAPCRVPVNSSSMTSDILKTVAEMEKASKPCDHTAKNYSTSQEGQTKIGQEKDNALVMYNGKVYFVANKTPALCNRPSKPLEASRSMGTSSTQAKENVGFNQRISLPPSLPLCSSSGSQLSNKTRPDPKHIVIPDEIIDLCDDDSQDDLTCQAISTRDVTRQLFRQSEVDEDEDSNVIFVSYLPPKAVPKVGEGEMSHMLDDFGAGQEMVRSQNNLNGEVVDSQNNVSGLSIERCQNVGTAHDMADCQDIATGQELNSRQQNITGQDWKRLHMEGFYGSATGLRIENIQSGATTQEMGNIQNDATDQSIGNSQHNASTQEMENIPESTALQTEMETHKKKSSSDPIPEQQTSMLDQESLETCDRLLKQMFGITSDVQICLKRIDSKPKANPKVFPQIGTTNKRTIEAIRKLLQRSIFVTKKRVHNETQVSATRNNDSCPKNAKRQKIEKVENAFKSSENPEPLTSQTPQLDMQPLTSQTPQLILQPLTSQTPQLILQPLTSQTHQLILQPLTSQTPQLILQPLTSQTPQLILQPLTSQTPQLDMQPLTSQTPQLDIQPLTSQTPQLDMQPLTSQTPQLILQPLTSQTPQLDMQPLTSQTPQLDIQPLTSQTPQLDIQPLTSQTPQLDMQPLTSQTPQLDMFFDGEQIFVYEEPTVNYFISTTDETVVPSKPLPDLDLVHISKPSSISPVSSVHPQTNTEAMDCAPRPCCGTESNIKPNSRRRRRGKGRRCTACPCEVTGTQVKAMSTSSTSQEEPDSSKPQNTRFSGNRTSAVVESTKRKGRKSTKAQAKDKEPASMEIQCPSTMSEQGSSTAGEIPTSYLCSTAPMDTEEIKRHERIKRLKDLLKEKEAALEMIRKNMS
ncbi:putative Polycomb group protein ASXL3 isoform X2 [Salvelinus fontinalis]|nr:putative Polycomb group protein ASXL3 isoform X2 [Salvelinus fontinalis]XP_055786854.1 putative Polycomb group protein ASXL3 isoform X2 [Salvelinus fontinalis]